MAPQIIYIFAIALNLILAGYNHGKEKKGKHNFWYTLIGLSIAISLVAWGGFFDPLFK